MAENKCYAFSLSLSGTASALGTLAAIYKDMNEPKNHHFVPECYLKPFTNNQGLLWKKDNERNYISSRSPSQVCYEINGNKIRTKDMVDLADIADTNWIEKEAFKQQENNYLKIHDQSTIYSTKPIKIESEKYKLFLKFLVTIKRRNPFTRNELIEMYTQQYQSVEMKKQMEEEMKRQIIEQNIKIDLDIKQRIDSYVESRAKNIDWLHDKYLSAYLYPDEFKVIENVTTDLYGLQQIILHAPTTTSFITSDNPGFVKLGTTIKSMGGLNGDFEFYFPLSRNTCLQIKSSDRDSGQAAEKTVLPQTIDEDQVLYINMATKSVSSNYILGYSREIISTV